MSEPDNAGLIGLDWGTSSLRGYLFDKRGQVIDRIDTGHGIQTVEHREFRAVFEADCARWLAREPGLPVVACGMIGSQQGWREARYAECPASLKSLGQGLTRIDDLAGRPFAIVPGLKISAIDQHPDVMRGEETQILGLGATDRGTPSIYVLPGSHSKWVRTTGDEVREFRSFLTGEMYSAIARHTIVGRLFPTDEPGFDPSAFADGIERIRQSPDALTAHLFSIRAQGLLGIRSPAALPSYLSGLLIGSELVAAFRWFAPVEPVTLVGSALLMQRYRLAFELFGQSSVLAPADSAAIGLLSLAREAGLIPT